MLMDPCCLEMTPWDSHLTGGMTEPELCTSSVLKASQCYASCFGKLVDIKPIAILVCFNSLFSTHDEFQVKWNGV
jgi:hypothetical protein